LDQIDQNREEGGQKKHVSGLHTDKQQTEYAIAARQEDCRCVSLSASILRRLKNGNSIRRPTRCLAIAKRSKKMCGRNIQDKRNKNGMAYRKDDITMNQCFVIQPFDNDKYDKRYVDIFEPAISKAGFQAYRIDKDLSVRVPIDEIEKGISESVLCFAEITTDNPNVWYELGYAFACGKDVVLVCSDERQGKFPFDIQHRHVISYKTGSTSDFSSLEDTITRKIKALQQKSAKVRNLNVTPVVETHGLKSHEIALLILIMENQFCDADSMSIYVLKNEMEKAGYTNIATSVAIRSLTKMNMVETFKAYDDQAQEEYFACRATISGEEWILSNQDKLEFRRQTKNSAEEDLPF